MPRGVADVLQIVVLAAGAHAALAGGRAHVVAPLLAQEHVLELHHAGVGEQQRRIVAGHQRGGRHDRMAVLAEVLEERAPHVAGAHVGRLSQSCARSLVHVGHRRPFRIGVYVADHDRPPTAPRAAGYDRWKSPAIAKSACVAPCPASCAAAARRSAAPHLARQRRPVAVRLQLRFDQRRRQTELRQLAADAQRPLAALGMHSHVLPRVALIVQVAPLDAAPRAPARTAVGLEALAPQSFAPSSSATESRRASSVDGRGQRRRRIARPAPLVRAPA